MPDHFIGQTPQTACQDVSVESFKGKKTTVMVLTLPYLFIITEPVMAALPHHLLYSLMVRCLGGERVSLDSTV